MSCYNEKKEEERKVRVAVNTDTEEMNRDNAKKRRGKNPREKER